MLTTLSVPQVIFVPPVLLLLSSLALFNFQNIFLFIAKNATGYTSNSFIRTIRPGLQQVKNVLETVLGKASSFKFSLQHVLLMSVVIMLMAIYNAIDKNNKLQEQKLRALEEQAKHKRD